MSVPPDRVLRGNSISFPYESEVEWISEWYLTTDSDRDIAKIVVNRQCECFDVDEVVLAYEAEHSSHFGWYEKHKKINIPPLNAVSKENLRALLNKINKYFIPEQGCQRSQIAYMLATARLEAYDWNRAAFFGPVAEIISYDQAEIDYGSGPTARKPQRARGHGHITVGDGYKYRGRGLVQITWKDNYEKFNSIVGKNLADQPDLALDIDIASKIMIQGMAQGKFTGHKLSDYITELSVDFREARRIINGTDKAEIIAGYAEKFERLLMEARCGND